MSYLELYLVFLKFGILCFGGGYMLVPLLTADLVENRHVLAPEAFRDLVSVAQVTPGPVAINTATYVGFLQHGILGAALATLGIITPALVLVILAIKLLKRYESTVWIQGFLTGMRPASWGLILVSVVVFADLSVFSGRFPRVLADFQNFGIRPAALLICLVVLFFQLRTKVSFYWLLAGSAVIGALFCR